jgi:hypothetical protein
MVRPRRLAAILATRNPDAVIDSAALASRLRNPEAPSSLHSRTRRQVVSSSDPRFKGKALLSRSKAAGVPTATTRHRCWCRLDRQYRSRGLEIVSLMFEQHTSSRLRSRRAAFPCGARITYPTLIAGVADKAKAGGRSPARRGARLSGLRSSSTAARSHVRKIHTGFAGPCHRRASTRTTGARLRGPGRRAAAGPVHGPPPRSGPPPPPPPEGGELATAGRSRPYRTSAIASCKVVAALGRSRAPACPCTRRLHLQLRVL